MQRVTQFGVSLDCGDAVEKRKTKAFQSCTQQHGGHKAGRHQRAGENMGNV